MSADSAGGSALEQALRSVLRDLVRTELRAALAELLPRSSNSEQANEWLTILEAAKFARVHPCTIREWIKDGSLKSSKAGRVYRLRREDINARMKQKPARTPDLVDLDRAAEEYIARQREKIARR